MSELIKELLNSCKRNDLNEEDKVKLIKQALKKMGYKEQDYERVFYNLMTYSRLERTAFYHQFRLLTKENK